MGANCQYVARRAPGQFLQLFSAEALSFCYFLFELCQMTRPPVCNQETAKERLKCEQCARLRHVNYSAGRYFSYCRRLRVAHRSLKRLQCQI